MDDWKERLPHATAVQQLQQGCARRGLHADVALELVAFLYLRRHFAPEIAGEEPQELSPGSGLDQLWHWMLLNTQVAGAVHKLIGGEVEHASSDQEDLSEHTKVVRRLAALNLLAAQGYPPTLGFWEEPGTSRHSLRHITYGPQQLPLYVPGGASEELCSTLARLVRGSNAILALSGPNSPAAAAHDPHALAVTHRVIYNPQPPFRFTLVFHMWPPQQHTPPRLQASTTVNVSCKPDATVGDLYLGAARYLSSSKDPTQAELEAVAGQLALMHGSTHYVDLGSSLKEAGLQQGHVVHVWQPGKEHQLTPGVVSRQELPPGFNITVQTLTGIKHVLLVHREMLVLELKQLVQDCGGVPPDQQRLLDTRGQMEDARTLGEYRVHEGYVITMVVRLRGC